MTKFHDVIQNSDEWELLRAGSLTSSNLSKVMANTGRAFGDPAQKLATKIAVEQIRGVPAIGGYKNEHMERGHEQEPLARALYENEFFCTVKNGGYFQNGFIGCSPDGLIDKDGLIEIKSVIIPVHFATLKRGDIDPAYKWQIYGNLYITGRKWIDFVSFCDEFPDDKKLIIRRVYADDISHNFLEMEERIEKFRIFVQSVKSKIVNSNYRIF